MPSRFLVCLSCITICFSHYSFAQIVVKSKKGLPVNTFYYYNNIGVKQEEIFITPKVKTIHTQTPVMLYASDEAASCFLLMPGDSVTIEFDRNRFRATSKKPERNKEIRLFENIYRTFLVKRYVAALPEMPALSDILYNDSLIQSDYNAARIMLFDTANNSKSQNIYTGFLTRLVDVKFHLSRLEFTRFANEKYFNTGSIGNYYNIFFPYSAYSDSLLLPDKIRCDTALGFYPGYWSLLAKDNNRSIYRRRIDQYKEYIEALVQNTYSYCDPVRDVLQFHLLAEIQKTLGDSIYTNYSTGLSKNKAVAEVINSRKLKRANPGNTGNDLINIKNEKAGGLRRLFEANKGNILYIDFWASWCVPCLQEMPFSKKIRDSFKGKKVKFIYLSVDDDFKLWKQAAIKSKLAQGAISYLFENGKYAPVLEKLGVDRFPRYMLIDTEGNILNANAPRPGDPALKKLLLQYLRIP
jgi:thiol-disulfide isomerase/thioredoxin